MHTSTLSDAWRLIRHHPRAFFLIVLSVLLMNTGCQAIQFLADEILPGALVNAWKFLWIIADFFIGLMCVSSAAYLLQLEVINGLEMSFRQTFTTYLEWFWNHWFETWMPFLIWNTLLPMGLEIGFAACLLWSIFSMLQNITPDQDWILVIENLLANPSMIASLQLNDLDVWIRNASWVICVFCFLILIITGIFSLLHSAVVYRGIYAVTAAWQRKQIVIPVFGECLRLAVYPFAAALLCSLAVIFVIFAAAFLQSFLLSLLFGVLLIVLALALIIFTFLYRFLVMIKILLDFDDPVLQHKMPAVPLEDLPELPIHKADEKPDFPFLPSECSQDNPQETCSDHSGVLDDSDRKSDTDQL